MSIDFSKPVVLDNGRSTPTEVEILTTSALGNYPVVGKFSNYFGDTYATYTELGVCSAVGHCGIKNAAKKETIYLTVTPSGNLLGSRSMHEFGLYRGEAEYELTLSDGKVESVEEIKKHPDRYPTPEIDPAKAELDTQSSRFQLLGVSKNDGGSRHEFPLVGAYLRTGLGEVRSCKWRADGSPQNSAHLALKTESKEEYSYYAVCPPVCDVLVGEKCDSLGAAWDSSVYRKEGAFVVRVLRTDGNVTELRTFM